MASYAWGTDVHLDHLNDDRRKIVEFAESLVVQGPTGILLTGDISVANQLVLHLSAIESVVKRPVYFVLGNHDYYGSSTEQVRRAMRELSNVSSFLRYMPTMPYYGLSPTTALVGHDGWYDAMNGSWQTSNFVMSDWSAIHDFTNVNGNRATIVGVARQLAHAGVLHVQSGIKQAARYHRNIIVLTHFPPFLQAHADGEVAAQPWYTSKMMGDMLSAAAAAYPTHSFTVLCGHTHRRWSGKVAQNMTVHVGASEYGKPQLQSMIEVA